MGVILTAAEGFGVDDNLVLGIDEGLAVLTLAWMTPWAVFILATRYP